MNPAMISLITRNCEVLIESIPCTVLQAILLSQQGGLAANPLQTTSMMIGLVATSYAVADSHVDLLAPPVSLKLPKTSASCVVAASGAAADGSVAVRCSAGPEGVALLVVLVVVSRPREVSVRWDLHGA